MNPTTIRIIKTEFDALVEYVKAQNLTNEIDRIVITQSECGGIGLGTEVHCEKTTDDLLNPIKTESKDITDVSHW